MCFFQAEIQLVQCIVFHLLLGICADRNLENLVAEDDVLGYDEPGVCPKALRSGKATVCDNMPVEAYRGSVHAKNELSRICRIWCGTRSVSLPNWCGDIHHAAQNWPS